MYSSLIAYTSHGNVLFDFSKREDYKGSYKRDF